MARTRLFVTDRDGNVVRELAVARIGTLDVNLSDDDNVTLSALPHELAELTVVDREVMLTVEGEEAPRFVGVPMTGSRGLDADRISIPISGLSTYLAGWLIDETLHYPNLDQLAIGAALVSWAQARPDSDANIAVADFEPSGVTRTRTYDGDELTSVRQALRAFRGLANGFDWAIVPVAPDRREWTPYYPHRGTFRPWRLVYREDGSRRSNVAAIGYTVDGSAVTREHYATTQTSGDVGGEEDEPTNPGKLVGSYRDPGLAGSGRILRQTSSMESSTISDTDTLVEHAQARVTARRDPTLTWEAMVTDPAIAMAARLGDRLEVDLADGWQAFAGVARIMGIRLNPVAERAVLTLAEEEDT